MCCSCGFVAKLVEVYRGFGYREDEGGGSRVEGYVSLMGGAGTRSPIWGISANRALWSLKSVAVVLLVVCALAGGRAVCFWGSRWVCKDLLSA